MKKLFQLVGYITVDGIEEAMDKLDSVEKKARAVIKPLRKFGHQATQVGKELTTNLTVPLAIAGGAVVKFGADFEKAMTNSLAIMDKDAKELRGVMEKTARNVAKTSTFSARQAAEAYYFLASAGKDAAQSIGALPRVAQFAQAGNFDLALATDLLTDAQSALGLSSKNTAKDMGNMTRVSDVLVKAASESNATVQQFAESLTNRAGAALRQLRKDVEEGVAVLEVFADQGKKGAEAGTALDIVLRDLQKASINNKEAFEQAGIAVFDESENMRNLADIIGDLEDHLGSLSDKQRRAELMTLGFTDKSVAATAALIGTSDAIRDYEKALRSAGGTTQEVANKQLESLWAQFDIVKSKLIDVAIELSGTLLPIIKDAVIPVLEIFAAALAGVAEWFSSLPDGVQKVVIALTAMVAVAGPLLMIVGKLAGSVTMLITVIKTLKIAMVALNAVMMMNPFAAVALAATILMSAIIALTGAKKNLTKQQGALNDSMREHEEIMRRQQKAQKKQREEFLQNVRALSTLEKLYKDHESYEKARTNAIETATKIAQQMGYVIRGNNDAREEAIKTIAAEIQGLRDAEGNLIKYTAAMKKTTDETEEVVKQTEVWTQKLREQGVVGVEAIELQREAARKKAQEDKASAEEMAALEEYFDNEKQRYWEAEIARVNAEVAAIQQAAEDKKLAEADYMAALRIEHARVTGDRLTAIELERNAEIAEAEATLTREEDKEAARKMIRDKYREEEIAAVEEHELQKDEARRFGMQMESAMLDERVQMTVKAINQLHQISQMSTQNKLARLNQEDARERKQIKDSIKDAERREKALAALDKRSNDRRQKLMLKQAKRDKASAVFAALLNTAQAVTNALASVPPPANVAFASLMGILGGAQVAMIAGEPLPELAEGGLVPQTPGGRRVVVGEGDDAEAILPMRKGAAEIASNIIDNIGRAMTAETAIGTPTPGGVAMVPDMPRELRPIQHIYQIGTLIADDDGLVELERRQLEIRVQEQQRKGQA